MSANDTKEYKVDRALEEKFKDFIRKTNAEEIQNFQISKIWEATELESYVAALNYLTILEEVGHYRKILCGLQDSLFSSLKNNDEKERFLYGGISTQLNLDAHTLNIVSEDATKIWMNNIDRILEKDEKFLIVYLPQLLCHLPGSSDGRDTNLLDKIHHRFLKDPEKLKNIVQEIIGGADQNQDVAVTIFGKEILDGADTNYEKVVLVKDFDVFSKFLPYLNQSDIESIFSEADVSNLSEDQGRILFEHAIDAFEYHEYPADIHALIRFDTPFPYDLNEDRKKIFFAMVLSEFSVDPREFGLSDEKALKVFSKLCGDNKDFLTQCFVMKSAMGIETFQEILDHLPDFKSKKCEYVDVGHLVSLS